MDYAIPASKIATLSSGEFVGIVADSPNEKISLKMFHAELQTDHEAIAKEEAAYLPIPLIRKVSYDDLQENYIRIKNDIQELVRLELKVPEEEKHVEEKKPRAKKRSVRKAVPAVKGKTSKGQQQTISL
ncbi:hypothetical protein ABIE26_003813 [Pedobacter africanus]|uniref:Uncharacterized protein n=1 Tax=Pedobacter africanus TaxID=151894 RepID=A0ACC6L110_9SPHI|nr:hypothetical protein [Pedobacter africanus]MDR6785115.1 hypothetical protein [Pedobacter africanus]